LAKLVHFYRRDKIFFVSFIFDEGELDEKAIIKDFLIVQKEGIKIQR